MNKTNILVKKIVEGIQEKKGKNIVIADLTEGYLPDDVLPYPNYEQLLFSI